MALDDEQEIIEIPRMKEESIMSDQVYNEESSFNVDPNLTSPTMSTSEEDYACYDQFDHTPTTPATTSTGQKRGRPVKDFTKWRPVKKSFAKKEWSDEEISLLINLWRNEEILYNTKNELHSNKEERTKSLERITYELQQNGISICLEQVSEKMTSLRCYYSGQIGKERASKTNGTEVFVSPWKFMRNMSFLESNYKPRNSDFNTKHSEFNTRHNIYNVGSGGSTHNTTTKINAANNMTNNTNNIYNTRSNVHDGNLHNSINIIPTDTNIYSNYTTRNNIHIVTSDNHSIINSIHNSSNVMHNGSSVVNDLHKVSSNFHNMSSSSQNDINNIHTVTTSMHNNLNNNHNGVTSSASHDGINSISSTLHSAAVNMQKDKGTLRNDELMANTLRHTGKIIEVALERLSKDRTKSSDESFGDLVISLLSEINNAEKKDMVKLEIHNLLVKTKYDT